MATKKTIPENMKIWERAFTTPVKHTKSVPGKGFSLTAVDAQYCIMKATELFGPVGEGWGYTTNTEFRDQHVVCSVSVWHGDPFKAFGPYVSIQPLFIGKQRRFDQECAKKGITDALTKCLSHLGIGGDVFMGMFDDNTYVARLRAEQAEKDAPLSKAFSPHPELTPEQEAQQREMDNAARSAADL